LASSRNFMRPLRSRHARVAQCKSPGRLAAETAQSAADLL
jgi:hypothetical protein